VTRSRSNRTPGGPGLHQRGWFPKSSTVNISRRHANVLQPNGSVHWATDPKPTTKPACELDHYPISPALNVRMDHFRFVPARSTMRRALRQ